MTEAAWVVLAGLTLAAAVPAFKFATKAIAHAIVDVIKDELNLDDLISDLAYVKDELTINGGETVKDRVVLVQSQVSDLQRDMEQLLGDA